RPVTVDEPQDLPRPRLAVRRPDRLERGGGPAAELHILGEVGVQDDDLAADLHVRVPGHDGHHAHEEREGQLARELHRPSPGRGRPGETTRVASIAPSAGESTTDVRSPGERGSPGGEQAQTPPGQRAERSAPGGFGRQATHRTFVSSSFTNDSAPSHPAASLVSRGATPVPPPRPWHAPAEPRNGPATEPGCRPASGRRAPTGHSDIGRNRRCGPVPRAARSNAPRPPTSKPPS